MATRLFADLVDHITPSAPGCPRPVVIQYARRVAIEACERTSAWRYVQADIVLVDGTYAYAFTPPADTEVHTVISATLNKQPLRPVSQEVCAEQYPFAPTTDSTYRSQPRHFVHFDPDTFHVVPCPDGVATYTVNMVLALKPLTSSTGMDKSVLDDLEDVVVNGTLQRLLTLPDRPWSDKELAAYHAKQYAFKTAERRARTNLGSGRAPMSVRQRPLA